MFEIKYNGANSVSIATKNTEIVSDPNLSIVGLKDIDVRKKVVLLTENRFGVDCANTQLEIGGAGEYEVGDFSIKGLSVKQYMDYDNSKKSTIYTVSIKEVKVVLLGNIAAGLSDEVQEAIGVVDICIIPVGGGGYTLDYKDAIKVIKDINPKVVIPVHYADSGVTYEVPQDTVDLFVKELGASVEKAPSLKIKGASSIEDTLKVVQIDRS